MFLRGSCIYMVRLSLGGTSIKRLKICGTALLEVEGRAAMSEAGGALPLGICCHSGRQNG